MAAQEEKKNVCASTVTFVTVLAIIAESGFWTKMVQIPCYFGTDKI
jgi:hypothetical protein